MKIKIHLLTIAILISASVVDEVKASCSISTVNFTVEFDTTIFSSQASRAALVQAGISAYGATPEGLENANDEVMYNLHTVM
ncbi:MAG: hypothetical protein L3J24_01210 [Xanthomonadales bacterium]|nr:hypothetical protein [Xanthomonadales bacterium]